VQWAKSTRNSDSSVGVGDVHSDETTVIMSTDTDGGAHMMSSATNATADEHANASARAADEDHWLESLEAYVLWYLWHIYLPLWLVAQVKRVVRRVRRGTVLELDLNQLKLVPEYDPADPLAEFLHRLSEAMTVRELVALVDRAAEDQRVVGLVARLGSIPAGTLTLTDAEELAAAVARFRATGKLTLAYAGSFGEFSPHLVDYQLATAFEEVCLQPSGDLTIPGVYAQAFFLRGTLDKLQVEPEFHQRHEYKNAANILTHTEFTDAHREATGAVYRGLFECMAETVAVNRQLSVAQVKEAINVAQHSSSEALNRGLIDHVMYTDQVWDHVRTRVAAQGGLRVCCVETYLCVCTCVCMYFFFCIVLCTHLCVYVCICVCS
jgi:Peptidase family S49